jgi:hypothetical protein
MDCFAALAMTVREPKHHFPNLIKEHSEENNDPFRYAFQPLDRRLDARRR